MEPANFGRNEPEMFHDLSRDFKAEAEAAAASAVDKSAAKVKA
jgi:hypothetical protein